MSKDRVLRGFYDMLFLVSVVGLGEVVFVKGNGRI